MRIGELIENSQQELTEAEGLYRRAENYAEIANRLRRAGYTLLRRHHHARIWLKQKRAIMVYVRGERAMTDYLTFCKNSTNRHTPVIDRGPVDVSRQHSMVGFEYIMPISETRWKQVRPMEAFSQSNDDSDDFESVDDRYPSLIRLFRDLHRKGFFRRFDYDLGKSSWMETHAWPILFAPFWTTRAGMFRESEVSDMGWGLEGFWITPEGDRIQIDEERSHSDIILERFSNVSDEDANAYWSRAERYDEQIIEYGLRAGWIRVLEEGEQEIAMNFHSGVPPKSAWSTLQRYLARDALAERFLFDDPSETPREFRRKAEALRFVGVQLR